MFRTNGFGHNFTLSTALFEPHQNGVTRGEINSKVKIPSKVAALGSQSKASWSRALFLSCQYFRYVIVGQCFHFLFFVCFLNFLGV